MPIEEEESPCQFTCSWCFPCIFNFRKESKVTPSESFELQLSALEEVPQEDLPPSLTDEFGSLTLSTAERFFDDRGGSYRFHSNARVSPTLVDVSVLHIQAVNDGYIVFLDTDFVNDEYLCQLTEKMNRDYSLSATVEYEEGYDGGRHFLRIPDSSRHYSEIQTILLKYMEDFECASLLALRSEPILPGPL